MKIVDYKEINADPVDFEETKNVKVRWLISEKDNAPNFAMRLFEAQPGGHSPWHEHDWEHEIFILEGEGTARSKDGEAKFTTGDVFFVPAGEQHQLINTGQKTLKFLCLIPISE